MPDPRLVIVVTVEDPAEWDYWASTVAAPVFSEIAGAAVSLLDIPPSVAVEEAGPRLAQNAGAAEGDNA